MKHAKEIAMAAYEKLTDEDREVIDRQAQVLETNIKSIWAKKTSTVKVQFGHLQALELLSALGMLMVGNGKR